MHGLRSVMSLAPFSLCWMADRHIWMKVWRDGLMDRGIGLDILREKR